MLAGPHPARFSAGRPGLPERLAPVTNLRSSFPSDSSWCSSTQSSRGRLRVKPPSSDAEALRSEQSAPVCATNRLFVAADELGHLASVQQPVRQALRLVRRRLLGDSILDSNRFRIRVLVPHGLLRGSTPIGAPPATPARRRPAQGAPHHDGADADVVGNDEPGGPARE